MVRKTITAPAVRPQLSRGRRLAFVLVAFLVVTVIGTVFLLGLDIYVHRRVQYEAGVNIWGYRGDVVGRKKPGETRLLAIGGSTVFGYGLPWNESWPYYLEQKIAGRQDVRGPVRVVNLGIPTDSARTFVSTLDDYAYLHADIVMFYEGYNDLGLDTNPPKNTTNPAVSHYLAWRHQSPVFRWTGYFPILPLVLNEKAQLLARGRNLNADGEVAFRPDLATRATAAAMKSAADIGVALERRLGQLTDVGVRRSGTIDAGCGPWSVYCGAVEEAVVHARRNGQGVIVITQPYFSDLHMDQQRALSGMIASRFGSDRRVRYVNLGRLINLRDQSIAYDGLHLVAAGNARIADELTAVVLDLMRS
jgi:lysophospholipase L1-like esterase